MICADARRKRDFLSKANYLAARSISQLAVFFVQQLLGLRAPELRAAPLPAEGRKVARGLFHLPYASRSFCCRSLNSASNQPIGRRLS